MAKKKSNVKILKQKRGEVPQALKDRVKEGNKIKKAIKACLADTPKTVLEISKEIGFSTEQVYWYITSMRKYGEIAETKEHKDLYYTYQLIARS